MAFNISIENRRTSSTTLGKRHPGATIIDVTSRGEQPWVRFSPFYPHGNIPVPFSPGVVAESVEGIWQALKVFESSDVDTSKLNVKNMKGIKRTTRSLGRVLGHRKGVSGDSLLPYLEARRIIYLPSYRWVLDNCLKSEIDEIKKLSSKVSVILLDYETNTDVNDLRRPLSHAGLIKGYIENSWPT